MDAVCRPMRLLHARHDDGSQGAARPRTRTRRARTWSKRCRGNICRCTGYEPIIHAVAGRRRAPDSHARGLRRTRWNSRKNYFADERKDDLKETRPGPASAPTCRATSPARRPISPTAHFPGMLLSQDGAQPAPPRPHQERRHSPRREKHPGVRRILTAKDMPHNLYTILILIQVGPEDEQVLAERQGALEGRGGGGRARRQRARRPARRPPSVKIDYEVLPAVLRHRGGAEARRAAGQRISRPELLSL